MSITQNLNSTFIASAAPATNFSGPTYTMLYVGNVIGSSTALLAIPASLPLPPAGSWTSAVLNLGVLTVSGPGASGVNIQKVTAPSPLDVTTVTYSTPGLTIDPTPQTTKSVSAADSGTVIGIDLTALINSWYATPFAGLAVTCTDGTFAVFDSMNFADPAKRPMLVLNDGTIPLPPPVTIAARAVDSQSESVTAIPADQESALRDCSQKTLVSFLVQNTGATIGAAVGIEEIVDGVTYKEAQTLVAPLTTKFFIPTYYSGSVRLYYHSNDIALTTPLVIKYIAQT